MRIVLAVYRLLLRLLPPQLRRRHEADMVEGLRELLEHERRRRGRIGQARAVLSAFADVSSQAMMVRIRRRPTKRGQDAGRDPGRLERGGSGSPSTVAPDRLGGARFLRGLVADPLMDVRHALRGFRRDPGFLMVAVATLGVGIAASSVIFGMSSSMILAELPYEDAEELVIVWRTAPEQGVATGSLSAGDYLDLKERVTTLEDVAAQDYREVNLTGVDEPRALVSYGVTANLFELLGVEAAQGRTFHPDDGAPDAPNVAVLSHRLWQSRFGADAELLGRHIELDGVSHEVVGIMPEGFEYPQFLFVGDLWTPLRLTAEQRADRGRKFLMVVGRLADFVSHERAARELARIAEQLADAHPSNRGDGLRIAGIQEQMAEPMLPALVVMTVAVGFVMLICCSNLAGLFLARTSSRRGEIAVRLALGAGRGRLVRQILTETVMVGLLGGVAGMVAAEVGGALLVRSLPSFVYRVMPSAFEGSTDWLVFGLTSGLAVVSGLLFGLAPALRLTRPDLGEALKSGGGGAADGFGRSRFRHALVVGEVALSIVLLVGAALMIRGFLGLAAADPGFDPDGVLTLRVKLPRSKYPEADDLRRFHERSLEAIEALPGVQAAAVTNILPLGFYNSTSSFEVQGRAAGADEESVTGRRYVSPGYLETIGIPIVRGRGLRPADDARGARPVAVVDREFVRRFLGDGEPLGRRIRFRAEDEWIDIVGVASDIRQQPFAAAGPSPHVYVPLRVRISDMMGYVIRTSGEPLALAAALRSSIWSIDPDQPIQDVQPLTTIVEDSLFIFRLPAQLMGAFAAAALLLAAVGLYGVVSFVVVRRTPEIGVRVALGASPRRVLGLVLRRGLALAVAGLVLGSTLALGVAQLLAMILFGVDPLDPLVLLGVPGLLLGVAFLATLLPARRALRIDPLLALRRT